MKRSKKLVCILMVILLLFSGCGKGKNSVVGEWYDMDGKCLTVSKDGIWDIEDGYGGGIWEYTEDDTFKFTDSLGNEMNVVIENDENGDYINLSYYGAFYKEKIGTIDENENDDQDKEYEEETEEKNYKVTYTYQTFDGKGLIQYIKDGNSDEKYYAMADLQGNVNYFPHEPMDNYAFEFGGNILYYSYESENSGICQEITNYDAKSLLNNENGEFDKILAIGNGMILLYRYRSSIDTIEHQYAIINSKGDFVFPWTALELYKDPTPASFSAAEYVGENIFSVCIGSWFNSSYMLINADTGKVIYLYNAVDNHNFEFSNGRAYISGNRLSAKCNVSFTPIDPMEDEGVSEHICLKTDGTCEAVSEFDNYSNGYVINYEKDGVQILDTKKNKTFKFTEYASLSKNVSMGDGLGLVRITAEDKQSKHFTMIDDSGKMLFEPIEYEDISCSDGKIIYKANDTYNIVDMKNGDLLVENVRISKTKSFDNGVMPTGSYGGYINTKGEEVKVNFKF